MKSSDILRAFTDAGADFAEQAADTNGETYQPDISAALDEIRGKDDAPPVTAAPEHESRMNRILLWACGIAACAAVGVTAVLFASRANSGNIIQPEGNAGGSVPMTVMTNPTTAEIIPAAVTDRDISFAVSKANYTDDEGFLSPDEQEALKSCVIRSAADLKANKIQPEKEYTDAFFDDHALVFVSTVFSCTGDLPEVTKVHVSGGTIEVTADREPAMAEALQWWCTFIEVSQADIAGTGNQIILHSDTQIQKQTELPASDSNLAFTVSDAVYQIADGSGSYNDLKNMVFFDTESLKRSAVQPVKQYDDAFFKDHALIFVTHVFSSMNQHETVIHSVHRTENALEIYAERKHDAVEAAALQWWCTFLEIDRAELEGNRAYDNVMLHVEYKRAFQTGTAASGTDSPAVTSETTAAVPKAECIPFNMLDEETKNWLDNYTPESEENLYCDKCGSGEKYRFDPDTRTVSLLSEAGTQNVLFTMTELPPKEQLMYGEILLSYIVKLSDHQYLVGGSYALKSEREYGEDYLFRYLYDTEKQHHMFSSVQPEGGYYCAERGYAQRFFSDGKQGIYLDDTRGFRDYITRVRYISADYPDGYEINLNVYDESWTYWNGNIYAVCENPDSDSCEYVRYDPVTKEKEVLLKDCDDIWIDGEKCIALEGPFWKEGKRYYPKEGNSIQIMDPDLQNSRTIPISIPEFRECDFTGWCEYMHSDLDYYFTKPSDTFILELFYENKADKIDEIPVYLLCNTKTGKMQYVYPESCTPLTE